MIKSTSKNSHRFVEVSRLLNSKHKIILFYHGNDYCSSSAKAS